MVRFTFTPPAWFGAPGGGRRRLMGWLRDRLAVRGVEAVGPASGDFRAALRVNALDGFVAIRLAPPERRGRRVTLVLERFGEADDEYDDALAACEDALAGERRTGAAGACL